MKIPSDPASQIRGYGLPQHEKSLAAKPAGLPAAPIAANRIGTIPTTIGETDFQVMMALVGQNKQQTPRGDSSPTNASPPEANPERLSPKQQLESTPLTDPKQGQGPTAPTIVASSPNAGLSSTLVAQLLSEK